MALAYVAAGRLTEAIALHEETVKLRESKLGFLHPNTLLSRNNLAIAYRVAGRLTEATELNESTLALYVSTLGPDHPDAAPEPKQHGRRLLGRRPTDRGDRAA